MVWDLDLGDLGGPLIDKIQLHVKTTPKTKISPYHYYPTLLYITYITYYCGVVILPDYH